MNINHRTYEDFPHRLDRLVRESGLTAKEFAEKIGVSQSNVSRYIKGTLKPPIETLCVIADCLNVTTDYLLCRKAAVLSAHSPNDNVYIYEGLGFDFKQLVNEYDEWLAAIIGSGALEKSASETVSLISLLLTIHLRDMTAVFKSRYDLPAEEYPAFYIRSLEIHKIVSHLFSRLANDVTSQCGLKSKLSATELNMKSCVSNLTSLFNGRSGFLKNIMLDNLLLTLEHSADRLERSSGRQRN